jgi:mercuric ion binding protein
MTKYLLITLALLFGGVLLAQDKTKKVQTVEIQTSAQCGDCKERLEDALNYTKGVKFAELDLDTKKITVKFDTRKITLAEVKAKIASTGYDADEVKADPKALEVLPMCCKPGGMK